MFAERALQGARLAAWERAAANTDRRSYLDAVDAQKRSLVLWFVSQELLRKPGNPHQGRRMRDLASDLAEQAIRQMRQSRRRSFRGAVAVEIDLHAVGVEQPPTSPPAVKAYLDLLRGIAYPDDRAVAYLRVTRHAKDNPVLLAEPYDFLYGARPRFPHGPDREISVRIEIQPLRTYTADVDRLFMLHERASGDRWDDDLGGARFFADPLDYFHDDQRLDELLAEEHDDREDLGLYAPGGFYGADPELRERLRRMREAELRALRRKFLLGAGPRPLDRPGPPPPCANTGGSSLS